MSIRETDEQRLAERVTAEMMSRDLFSQWLGIAIIEIKPRAATVRMTVREEMVNGFGVCHGGVTFSLADSALAFACNTHGRVTMSIENSIRYPATVRVGDVLTAQAEEDGASNRLAFFAVTVRNQRGESVGLFRGTVYRTKRDFFANEGEGA